MTANAVKIGFLLLDVGGLDKAGASVGVDPAQEQSAYQAYVDDINKHGGINGRQINPVYVKYNVLSSSSGNAGSNTGPEACRTLTEQEHVFGVVGLLDPTDVLCVTRDHQTPMLNTIPGNSDASFNQSGGRLFSLFPAAGRMMREWVAQLDRAGVLKGKKIGIASGGDFDPGYASAGELVAALKAAGHTVTRVSEFSGDISQASSQMPVEVSQQAAAGTQVMMMMMGTINVQQFVQSAQAQGDNFQYTVSDFASLGSDPVNKMPQSYQGTIGISSIYPGGYKDRTGFPEQPQAAKCNSLYSAKSGNAPYPQGTNAYGLTMLICDSTYLFAKIAQVAGENLTRASFISGAARLGTLGPSAYMAGGSLSQGKPDYADYFRMEKYDSACNCFRPDGSFQHG